MSSEMKAGKMNVHELSQRTAEALIRAGWARGCVSDPQGFHVDWTDEGLVRLKLLFHADISSLKLDRDQVVLLCTWAALAGEANGWDKEE